MRAVLSIALLTGALAKAQDPIHVRYTTSDGLASNTVYGIVQDRRGFIWIGSDAGACRFDGHHFTHFGLQEGLPDEEVLHFFEDSRKRMWFLLLNGKLAFVRNDTLYHPGNCPMLRPVTGRSGWARAAEDRQGRVWFGGVWGELLMLDTLGRFHLKEEIVTRGSGGNVVPMTDAQGDLFVQVNGNGYVVEGDQLKPTYVYEMAGNNVTFTRSTDGRLWAAAAEGLISVQRRPGPVRVRAERAGPWALNRAMAFADGGMLLYARTDHGVAMLDTATSQVRMIFEQAAIKGVFIDEQNNCWLSTAHDGVIFVASDELRSRVIDRVNGEAFGAATRLHVTSTGALWVGTERGLVLDLSGGEIKVRSARAGDARVQSVRDLTDDGRSLFVATDLSTSCIPLSGDGARTTIAQWDARMDTLLTDAPSKLITVLRDGTLLGAYYELMREHKTGDHVLYPYLRPEVGGGRFHLLFEAPDSALWIQRNDTLYRWYRGVLEPRADLSGEPGMRATSMVALRDGTLVIGTVGQGLIFLRDLNIIRRLRKADGLLSDRCPRLHVSNDTIVVASQEGVDLVVMGGPGRPRGAIQVLSMPHRAVNDALLWGGRLHMATEQGLLITTGPRDAARPRAPHLYVSRISNDERTFAPGSSILVHYGHRSLQVEVTAVSFAPDAAVTYEYRLDGIGPWLSGPAGSFSLLTDEAGEHELAIRARAGASAPSAIATVPFAVIPPFWQRSMFRLPVTFALILTAWYLLRTQARRRYRRGMEELRHRTILAEERERIAMDLHDDLGSDISGTALLAEAALQRDGDPRTALMETIERLRGMLPKVDEIIWSLDRRNDRLSGLIAHVESSSSKRVNDQAVKFEFVATHGFADREVSAELRRVVMLLVKESITNALKHARASHISMTMIVENGSLALEVQDDGVGLVTAPGPGQRHGLKNMRARVERLGGRLAFEDVRPRGTRVSLDIPLPTT